MCGRYAVNFDHDTYLADVPIGYQISSFNVAPTHSVPIIVERLVTDEQLHDAGLACDAPERPGVRVLTDEAGNRLMREIHSAQWGLIPGWAQDASFASRAFNARSETVMAKPTFRAAALRGHCAIPASGYYEWKTLLSPLGKASKTPYFVHREDGQPLYFAGLYEWWKITADEANKPNSPYTGQAGQWLLTCSILTMASSDELDAAEVSDDQDAGCALVALGDLHDRLPVPLQGKNLARWLRSGRISGSDSELALDGATALASAQAALSEVLADAYAEAASWRMYAVSAAVGSVANNFPELIEPAEDLLTGL